jgi:TolB-like protein/DNA-binding winged helix-turn-helix (wHTH) protein/tetratricopeptide (TPR) repeat protein
MGSEPTATTRIKIGAWTATPALNLLERSDRSCKIERRAMDVLIYLADRAGQVASVSELIASVWRGVVVGDGSVYLAINQLRSALEEPSDGTRYIETIPKRGYRLTVPVERLEAEPTPSGTPATQRITPGSKNPPFLRGALGRRLGVGTVIVAALAVAYLGVEQLRHESDRASDGVLPDGSSAANPRDASEAAPKSIAVLPFENLSTDRDQDYFATGVAGDIRNALSRIPGLQVSGGRSSSVFKGRTDDSRRIGETLGVEFLLEGEVQKDGDQLRIRAELVRARTGFDVWTYRYDTGLANALKIQAEIARTVAVKLEGTLGQNEIDLAAGGTENPNAYDHYLSGQQFFGRGFQGLPDAADEFERALELDPKFGLAAAALAEVRARQASFDDGGGLANERDQAIARAMELAPDLPATSGAIAEQEMSLLNWEKAEEVVSKMRARTSENNYDANLLYGRLLLRTGRASESLTYLERARSAEPIFTGPYAQLTVAHDALGHRERALQLYEQMSHLVGYDFTAYMPQFWRLLTSGDIDGARAVIQFDPLHHADWSSMPPRTAAFDRMDWEVFGHLDDRRQGRALVRNAYRNPALDTSGGMAHIGTFAAYFGDADLSIAAWRKSLLHDPVLIIYIWTPGMQPVRVHPEFKQLVKDLNLVTYWRHYGWPDHCHPVGTDDFECD